MGLRRKSRKLALQFLYKQELNGEPVDEEGFISFCVHFQGDAKAIVFAESLVFGVAAHLEQVDALIQENSLNWRLSRMSAIDRNLLRLAIYELTFTSETPSSVVINEAIEIAKEFSTDDAGSFINGILDAVIRNR